MGLYQFVDSTGAGITGRLPFSDILVKVVNVY